MPDTQPTPQHSVAANDIAERDVMYLLTDPEDQRHWSEKEIGDEIEDPVGAADVLRGLERAGLMHRTTDGFVFAARPAIRFRELIGGAFTRGQPLWRLTSAGVERLQAVRQSGELELPESPQHRDWREARSAASEQIAGFRDELRAALADTADLL